VNLSERKELESTEWSYHKQLRGITFWEQWNQEMFLSSLALAFRLTLLNRLDIISFQPIKTMLIIDAIMDFVSSLVLVFRFILLNQFDIANLQPIKTMLVPNAIMEFVSGMTMVFRLILLK
jgi:hypothetical protein